MKRLGYKPDHHDPRDVKFGTLVRATAQPPPSSSGLKSYSGGVTDQEDSSGCVGWSLSGGIWSRWNYLSEMNNEPRGERPSAIMPWWCSRQLEGLQNINEGTYIRDAVKQVVKLGICPESIWPSNPPSQYVGPSGEPLAEEDGGVPRFAMQPSTSAFQHAADQRFPLGYYRLSSDTSLRRTQVSQAISSHFPVIIGTQLTVGFLELKTHGPQPVPLATEEIAGGHALQLTHYDENGVYGPNSWGPLWGNAGWFALSWEYILWEYTQDLWAIDAGLPNAWPEAA